jgi:hypothetical protein
MGYKNWTLAIRGWADEKKDFTYASNIQHGDVGHYTQVDYKHSIIFHTPAE